MVKRNQSKHPDEIMHEDEPHTSTKKKSPTHRKRGRGKSTRKGKKGRSHAKHTTNKKSKRTGRRGKRQANHTETVVHAEQ